MKDGYAEDRREKAVEKLNQTKDALLKLEPVEALDHLKEVLEHGDENLRADAYAYRNDALRMIRQRIEFLDRQPRTEQVDNELQTFIEVCNLWDPSFVQQRDRDLARRAVERETGKTVDEEFLKLQELVEAKEGGRVATLAALDREVRASVDGPSQLMKYRCREVRALRESILRGMTRWERTRVGFSEWLSSVDELYSCDEEDNHED